MGYFDDDEDYWDDVYFEENYVDRDSDGGSYGSSYGSSNYGSRNSSHGHGGSGNFSENSGYKPQPVKEETGVDILVRWLIRIGVGMVILFVIMLLTGSLWSLGGIWGFLFKIVGAIILYIGIEMVIGKMLGN